ncbi:MULTISPECIES: preprotein translocase subunit SecY [Brevibacterium]|uniref:Protein translocase subunit SecY n=1 Tax=Brevibacterium luteolum TaxID=199591 RepID=A0A2N6PJ87_9MICO|nr:MULTISPECIES: preprotein translocase subunit SecY [Brevibacterium]MBU8579190.1 preprotein translocase subunit SecY [Brevibacterium luteolum]MCT1655947.1 preprotein translocase subunit SecY [Brevibacterium luteolum]MCT1921622.1 preprotein translocase subunit SecY [Brevibacterium luteolum]PMB98760.1 preprotein translocase subunit SecY [Brevibacterium luteolum]QIN30336.1 preprotein translocase subunit SecY [Brevibacterium luteolum]
MLGAIGRAFKTPDLRNKLLFTLGIVVLYRIGVFIPAPGIDYGQVQECVASPQMTQGAFGLINLFSGGALLQLSIFALGIMPYITASIITQLLRVVIPRFEALHKEGASGQAKLTQYTRYMTIGLGLLNATTLVTTVRSGALFGDVAACQNLIVNDTWWGIGIIVLTLTAGTGLIMWMGEQITERGVGNGMSLMIFTAVAAGFPASFGGILRTQGIDIFAIVLLVGLAIVTLVVFVEQSQRRIPVQYAKRMVGRRMFGGTSTYIPIKVNQAGVIPVIFASSVLYLPSLISQFGDPESPWVQWINKYFTSGDHPLYMAIYFLLTIFFAYFYVAITFNPEEVADNMKKYGGFIPGIRAGKPTERYLSYVLTRITFPGSLYLAVIAMIPLIALVLIGANQDFPFGGTSILIVVGVGLETVKQIDSQMQQRHYEGLLR